MPLKTPEPEPVAPPKRSRRGHGGITLVDVARLAGVAPITASRALNEPQQVSPAVRERVLDAVQRSGYVPNRLAGGLASNRSRLVAALVPTLAGPVFLETVQALTEALDAEGYQLMLGQSGYADSREDALLDAIIGRRPDGIVLTGILHSPQGRQRLLASGIPIVETWDLTPTPLDMLVGFSHERVGEEAVRFLHARGRRRLALISGSDERALRRNQASQDEARRLGLVGGGGGGAGLPVALVPSPTTLGAGRQALSELLDAHPALDAVFCSSDLLALGVLTEAQARGLAVPARLGVLGFGDMAFARDLHPALSTVRIDGTAIGRQAARFIVERAQGLQPAQRVVDLGFQIVARDSA